MEGRTTKESFKIHIYGFWIDHIEKRQEQSVCI